jgi:lipoprotein-releasing system permease protein
MYKWLLCWRYLRTRYLALVCIVSVMLGVATLIVVNAVMGGFSTKLRERLHGLLSDVMLEANDYNGFGNYEGKMELIRRDKLLGAEVEAMAPVLESFAMVQYRMGNQDVYQRANLVGIDLESRSAIGGFSEFIVLRKGDPKFELDEAGKARFAALNRPGPAVPPLAPPFPGAEPEFPPGVEPPPQAAPKPLPAPPPGTEEPFVPAYCILGHAMAHRRWQDPNQPAVEVNILPPGEDVIVSTISGGRVAPVTSRFTVCDYFRSEMSEYDSNFIFVPLDYLQKLRTMEGRVTSIQIRLKDERKKDKVVARLKELFGYSVQVLTWEDKQGALLAAISIEKGILNVLLFLIIAVAGFGILAIFSMIVVEKTRDIGILKALGASNSGVMQIFLCYGLLLGCVGAAAGTGLGLLITEYINEIEAAISASFGMEVFPRSVYYFDKIPTHIEMPQILLINIGSILIAVVFSILPAMRAAMLHPVRALRFE